MKRLRNLSTATALVLTAALTLAVPAAQAATKFVGGAPMMSSDNIVTNASKAPNLSTLVAAVQAADLVATLASPGPFTVFAPTNIAFKRLPAGTVETLLKPENKGQLTKVLTYHVVPGTITSSDLSAAIAQHGGSFTFPTVAGNKLTATKLGLAIVITDENGGMALVQNPDVMQSNGVVHVINKVLLPK